MSSTPTKPSARRLRLGLPTRWLLRYQRPVVQILALVLFLGLFLCASRPAVDLPLPADLFLRMDPLAAIGAMLSAQTPLSIFWLSAGTVLLTLLLGRVWCGWLCPMGTVLDLVRLRRKASPPVRLPESLRVIKVVLLFVILTAAVLGNLTLLFLDPITLLMRSLAAALAPAFDAGFSALERLGFAYEPLQAPILQADFLLRGTVLRQATPAFQWISLSVGLFLGILALNAVTHRFWCRYLCPLGGLLGTISRLAPLRRRVHSRCVRCGRCAESCPMGTIDAAAGYASDPVECILCLKCGPLCPPQAISFPLGRPTLTAKQPYDPGRRHLLASLGLGALGVALLKVVPAAGRVRAFLIRPPGGRENDIARRCVRCGACLQVCPTAGLQPAWDQDGLGGIWTPVLVPRLGACDFSCTACGDICPTGAIPKLPLELKRTVIIGQAYIDHDRCLPWADNRGCTVCEEMCPVPDKAIKLDEVKVNIGGVEQALRRPRVERERCIGCGICEHDCPLAGEAAIRVYYPTDLGAAAKPL